MDIFGLFGYYFQERFLCFTCFQNVKKKTCLVKRRLPFFALSELPKHQFSENIFFVFFMFLKTVLNNTNQIWAYPYFIS